MSKSIFKKGDSYNLEIELLVDGAGIDVSLVDSIEFTIGKLVKRYPAEVGYIENRFLFPLSQKETFSFSNETQLQMEARIKFNSGAVMGTPIMNMSVDEVLSKVVL